MINSTHLLQILVIEDSPSDFYLFNEYLQLTQLQIQTLHHATSLAAAIPIVDEYKPDLIFLDLTLPDSEGIATFQQLHQRASHIGIIVLSGLDDKLIALQTIAEGAQDYLMKGEYDDKLLTKAIQYSIERKKILQHVVENYERFNTLIKATNDTIWEWDLDTHQITWNEGITNTYGYPASKVKPTTAWHHKNIHADDRERVLNKIALCLSEGQDQWEDEYRYLTADGFYKHVYDRGYILKRETKPYGMIGAMLDITERKRKQEELIETQKLITRITIQTQEQERREIGLELHDNINQILATAKLCVDMAINDDDISKELLYKSYDSISKAINEIRALSKNLVPPSLGDIGLKEALQEMIENMSVSSGLKIKIRANDPQIESLSDNKKLILYRIVQEQVNNIVKHARATVAEIELKNDQQHTILSIRDNGIGFDPKKKGKGIGLHNILSRVEMQNGNMEIISSVGAGCTLRITMPL